MIIHPATGAHQQEVDAGPDVELPDRRASGGDAQSRAGTTGAGGHGNGREKSNGATGEQCGHDGRHVQGVPGRSLSCPNDKPLLVGASSRRGGQQQQRRRGTSSQASEAEWRHGGNGGDVDRLRKLNFLAEWYFCMLNKAADVDARGGFVSLSWFDPFFYFLSR